MDSQGVAVAGDRGAADAAAQLKPAITVQQPPVGVFDHGSVEWTPTTSRGKPVKVAFIPTNRLPDFIRGEGLAGCTQFYKSRLAKAVPSQRAATALKLGDRTSYNCGYGPQDFRHRLPPPSTQRPASGIGSRPNTKTSRGASQRRGCQANFMAAPLYNNSSITKLHYFETRHLNHGPDASVAGRAAGPPHISDAAREFVRFRVVMDPHICSKQIKLQWLEHLLIKNGVAGVPHDEALVLLQRASACDARDADLSTADIK
jgi:hypothetical protein